ncbi:MAG: GGDEF domain-containing protein [Butyrivibrio sp.]|nr:GGDEF domain-containing protein [Butyrivibrio sp.]
MQTEYAAMYFEINLASLVLISIIFIKTNGLSKMVAQRNFAMGIISEMVFFISDTIFVLINCDILPKNRYAMMACKEIYFFSTAMMCFFWFLYFEHLRETRLIKDRKTVGWLSSVLWLMGILLIANWFGGFLFYVDEQNVYRRGSLFILTYILSYVYVLIAWIRAITSIYREDEKTDRHLLVMLALFPIAPGISGIIQYVYPRLPVECVVMAITTLLLYLNWIDQLISLDPLTGLNNRKQLSHSFDQLKKAGGDQEKLYLLLIDANHFKQINDTYGHLQGDLALKMIAEALRKSCRETVRRAVVARYGGDEFTILISSDSEEKIKEIKTGINRHLEEIVKNEQVPFELTVSIGIATASENDQLKNVIAKADQAMYEEKHSSCHR